MGQEVIEYINQIKQSWQAPVCTKLREVILNSIPEVTERLQYGKAHFLKNGKYACVFGAAKGWISFTLFNATRLEAPNGLFEPTENPERKTIKIKEGQVLDYALLAKLIKQAANAL